MQKMKIRRESSNRQAGIGETYLAKIKRYKRQAQFFPKQYVFRSSYKSPAPDKKRLSGKIMKNTHLKSGLHAANT